MGDELSETDYYRNLTKRLGSWNASERAEAEHWLREDGAYAVGALLQGAESHNKLVMVSVLLGMSLVVQGLLSVVLVAWWALGLILLTVMAGFSALEQSLSTRKERIAAAIIAGLSDPRAVGPLAYGLARLTRPACISAVRASLLRLLPAVGEGDCAPWAPEHWEAVATIACGKDEQLALPALELLARHGPAREIERLRAFCGSSSQSAMRSAAIINAAQDAYARAKRRLDALSGTTTLVQAAERPSEAGVLLRPAPSGMAGDLALLVRPVGGEPTEQAGAQEPEELTHEQGVG